jgi:hypothetical protein
MGLGEKALQCENARNAFCGRPSRLPLIGLHAGAALFHGLVLRDGVLQRMLPSSRAARAGRRMLVGKHKVIS